MRQDFCRCRFLKLKNSIFLFGCTFFIFFISAFDLVFSEIVSPSKWALPLEFAVGHGESLQMFSPFGTIAFYREADGNVTAEFSPASPAIMEELVRRLTEFSEQQQRTQTQGKRADEESGDEPKTRQCSAPDYCLRTTSSDKKEQKTQLLASNFARAFVDASFAHLIDVSVDPWTQTVLSVLHSPHPAYRDREGSNIRRPSKVFVEVRVTAVRKLQGPETAQYLQRLEEERRARQHGAMQDNRPFFAKYWMYIVPVVIFLLFSNMFAPEQPENAGAE